MAEKKTEKKAASSKKATKQANPKAVDMVSPVTPADETGLELTEERVSEELVSNDVLEELENPSTEEFTQSPTDAEVVFETSEVVMPTEKAVEAESCEKKDEDDEPCDVVENQELEIQENPFTGDDEMVNDITNILNGLDGVKANKVGEEEKVEDVIEKKEKQSPKNVTNTEEKNYYSEQFSRSWGGVMYDY